MNFYFDPNDEDDDILDDGLANGPEFPGEPDLSELPIGAGELVG